MCLSIIITILIFGIVVMIHEWGHFISAKRCGVTVEEFAIGMGPKLWKKQRGETLYSVRLFPIGGFCKMADEDDEGSKKVGFNNISVWKRMIVILAGVFMNFVLAIFINAVIIMFIGYAGNTVLEVITDSPAERAGIMAGDKIVSINNSSTNLFDDIAFSLSQRKGENVIVGYERNGEYFEANINVPRKENLGIKVDRKVSLFEKSSEGFESVGFFDSVRAGFWKGVYMVKITFYGIGQLFTMQVSLDDVAGPIGLTSAVDTVYEKTIQVSIWNTVISMAEIAALLSANLGVMNLLPIPALDGGRFVFLIIEAIRRKPIPPEKEGMIHFAGFAILMAFGILVAFNDVFKLL